MCHGSPALLLSLCEQVKGLMEPFRGCGVQPWCHGEVSMEGCQSGLFPAGSVEEKSLCRLTCDHVAVLSIVA